MYIPNSWSNVTVKEYDQIQKIKFSNDVFYEFPLNKSLEVEYIELIKIFNPGLTDIVLTNDIIDKMEFFFYPKERDKKIDISNYNIISSDNVPEEKLKIIGDFLYNKTSIYNAIEVLFIDLEDIDNRKITEIVPIIEDFFILVKHKINLKYFEFFKPNRVRTDLTVPFDEVPFEHNFEYYEEFIKNRK